MTTQTADNSLSTTTSRADAYPSPYGPKGRRVFRFMARLLNPLVLRIATAPGAELQPAHEPQVDLLR